MRITYWLKGEVEPIVVDDEVSKAIVYSESNTYLYANEGAEGRVELQSSFVAERKEKEK